MIFFVDKKSKEKIGTKTGCNQTGIFISKNEIVFLRKRKIRKINLEELTGSKIMITQHKDKSLIPKITKYFNNIHYNYRLFILGIRAIAQNNIEVFNCDSIMPKIKKYQSTSEYNAAWDWFLYNLKKGDILFTFNSKSIISKIIASIDKGSWSHCGIYAGEGKIFEALSSGRVLRSIENYRKQHIHIGVYRPNLNNPDSNNLLDKYIKSEIGPGYGYLKALMIGIRTILGLNDGSFEPTDVTPNGIIYSGSLYLVGDI